MQEALHTIKNGDLQDAKAIIEADESVRKQNESSRMTNVQDVEFETTAVDESVISYQAEHLYEVLKNLFTTLIGFNSTTDSLQKMPSEEKKRITTAGKRTIRQIEVILQNLYPEGA